MTLTRLANSFRLRALILIFSASHTNKLESNPSSVTGISRLYFLIVKLCPISVHFEEENPLKTERYQRLHSDYFISINVKINARKQQEFSR